MDDNNDLAVPLDDEEDRIPDELIEILADEDIGEETKKKVLRYAEMYSGPLPPPRMLAQYQEIIPDAANRIIIMAETQQKHRHEMESALLFGDITRSDRGLLFGFILFAMLGGGSILLLSLGKDMQGYALLGTTVVGGIVNFIRVGIERTKRKDK